MAQDFGDDIGEMFFNAIKRKILQDLRDLRNDVRYQRKNEAWNEEKLVKDGMSREDAKIAAATIAARPQVCLDLGNSTDAAYFAQVCRTNGFYATALTDAAGNGYVMLAKEDLTKNARELADQFSKVMVAVKSKEIIDRLNRSNPVTQEKLDKLKEIDRLPPLPHIEKGAPAPDISHEEEAPGQTGDDKAPNAYNHTLGIRDTVLAAREQCTDLEDFKRILAKDGIGVTLAADGGIKLYEARLDEQGDMLPFDKTLDWTVNAKTLSEKYECDVTAEWFEKNTPKEPSVHPPIDRQSPDLNVICNAVRGDLEEKGIQTIDRPDGKMGFIVDKKYKQDVADAVETRFPGHAPEELGIEFDNGRNDPPNPPTPPVIDGSLDMDGRTPDLNQGIESHDGADTATATARIEREQVNSDVAPSAVRESSGNGKGYDLKSTAQECRDGSKQLEKESGIGDRDIDISDKFDRNR